MPVQNEERWSPRWASMIAGLLLTAILVGNVYVGLEPTVGLCDADPCGETTPSQAHPTSALRQLARQGLADERGHRRSRRQLRAPRLRTDRSVQASQVLRLSTSSRGIACVWSSCPWRCMAPPPHRDAGHRQQREVGRLLQPLGIRVVAIEGHLVHDAVIQVIRVVWECVSTLIFDSNNADERDLSSAETSSRPFLTYSSRSMSGWLSLPPSSSSTRTCRWRGPSVRSRP